MFDCPNCATEIPVENVGAELLEGRNVVRCHGCGTQLTIGITDVRNPEGEGE